MDPAALASAAPSWLPKRNMGDCHVQGVCPGNAELGGLAVPAVGMAPALDRPLPRAPGAPASEGSVLSSMFAAHGCATDAVGSGAGADAGAAAACCWPCTACIASEMGSSSTSAGGACACTDTNTPCTSSYTIPLPGDSDSTLASMSTSMTRA